MVDPLDPTEDWHKDWLDFAMKILPEKMPRQILPQYPELKNEAIMWVNDVVSEFSLSHIGKWAEFVKNLDGDG